MRGTVPDRLEFVGIMKYNGWAKLLLGVLVFIAPLAVVFVITHVGAHPLAAANQPFSAAGAPTDPALLKYHEVRAIPTGLTEPRALALGPDGTRYVAGDMRVMRLGADDALTTLITPAAPPYCLAVGKDGLFYVGLKDHVEVYDGHGARKARWAAPGRAPYLTALALHGNTVWVADAGNRIVWRYDRTGHLSTSMGQRNQRTGAPGLVAPSPHLDLATARDGTLWVANPGRHELEHYADDGSLQQAWGQAGNMPAAFSGCCNPTDFALLADGGFVTAEKKLPRVKIYRADGTFAGFVAGPENFDAKIEGMSLAVDARGEILVLDSARKTVRVFAPNSSKK